LTRSALAEELWSLLNEKPQTKRDVVHVLIQIRKVIEHDGKPAKYEVLEFFCDWVAHPKPELEHLEPCDCSTSNCRLFTTSPKVWMDPKGVVHEILSLDLLRQGMLAFLGAAENDLPTRWAEDDSTSVKLGKTSGYPPPTVPALRAQRNGPHGTFPSSAGYCIRARPSAWEVTGLLSENAQSRTGL
jgi:hypothetical protein